MLNLSCIFNWNDANCIKWPPDKLEMGSAKPQRGDQDKCEIPQSLWHLVNVALTTTTAAGCAFWIRMSVCTYWKINYSNVCQVTCTHSFCQSISAPFRLKRYLIYFSVHMYFQSNQAMWLKVWPFGLIFDSLVWHHILQNILFQWICCKCFVW